MNAYNNQYNKLINLAANYNLFIVNWLLTGRKSLLCMRNGRQAKKNYANTEISIT